MPEVFILDSSEHHPNRQPSPFNNDRYTPVPNEINQQPFRSSSPPIKTFQARPELYHLNAPDDKPQPMPMSLDEPQSYSPTNPGNNRVSPLPRSNLKKQGPEMYHLVGIDDSGQQSAPIKTTRFNDQPTRYDIGHDSPDQPGKVTVFTISSNNDENIPPPIRPTKNKQQPFSYDIVHDENKYPPPPPPPLMAPTSNKQRAFPTGLHEVSTNVRYIPLEQSKATESIARSMNKYRFAGY